MRAAAEGEPANAQQAVQFTSPVIRRSAPEGGPLTVRGMMALRVSLFIDFQNVYHGARYAFHHGGGPSSNGQISPRRVADLLCARRPRRSSSDQRLLHAVRVYRGMPRFPGRGHIAAQRQHEAWEEEGVTVITRPLAGPPNRAREKGVDVELALDFFAGAIDGDFDVGIIFSADADLLPAFEKVLDPRRALGVSVEIATWWNPPATTPRLARSLRIPHHRLDREAYASVRDQRSYMLSSE